MVGNPVGRRLVVLGALGGLAALCATKGHAASAIPVVIATGRCVVTVLMDGRPASMILDTGAERSVITRAAMARLGLQPDPWIGTTLRGAGGMLERHANAVVGRATLGGAPLVQLASLSGLRLSVTQSDLGGVDGLLGGDVLRHATLYLDVPRRRLLLFPPDPVLQDGVALQTLRDDLLLVPVRLDGCALTALIDTGASASLINLRGLDRLGLAAETLQRDPAVSSKSLGGRLTVRAHRFRQFGLGAVAVESPVMMTVAVPEPEFDLILGMDILGLRPLLLSYAALKLRFNAG